MNNIYRKVSRGQVWFINDDKILNGTSIQGGKRPYLFVSNNMCNQSSPTYTVVPLTTQVKTNLPTHVEFDIGGKHNTVLCEQIRTIPHELVTLNGSYYMLTLSDDIMREVDEALSVQLGLQIIFPNADRYWESLGRLIRAKVKEAVMHSKVDAIDISKVATLLDNKVDEIVKQEVQPTIETQPIVPEPQPIAPAPEEPKGWAPHKPTKPRNKWTTESMKTFLEDCDKYTTDTLCKKYDMSMKTVYVTKSKFKKLLNGES